jgi:hypothetical protein
VQVRNSNPLIGLLGEAQPLTYRNSTDRYGFSWVLAEILKKEYPPRAFCDWVHGWVWWEDLMKVEDLVGARGAYRNASIVVCNLSEFNVLAEAGYTNVSVGGLPFAYVRNQHTLRCEHSLLAFIGKSAEVERHNVLDLGYLDFLASQVGAFENIYVSVAVFDQSRDLIREIKRRSLHPVPGSHPTDKRSLLRTRISLEHCKYVSTNTFGSHIAYALAVGCHVSVFTPLYRYNKNVFLNTVHQYSQDYADRLEYIYSEVYLRRKWSSLFVDNPREGLSDASLGCEAIGHENLLDSEGITRVLGWHLRGQLRGYTVGGIRRACRAAVGT